MGYQEEEPPPTVPTKSMALFMLSIPLMVLAVALAVLPLILMSHADHRRRKEAAIPRRGWVASEFVADETESVPQAA